MKKSQRSSPTSTPKDTLAQGQPTSDSDLTSCHEKTKPSNLRSKRQRIEDSPSKQTNLSNSLNCFKGELKQMLDEWKTDQDQRLATWKAEQDATLSMLVREVSDLKTQCQQIQKSNLDIERGMDFVNQNYEEIKGKITILEQEKKENLDLITNLEKQLQDSRFLTRTSTIELRNISTKQSEKTSDLTKIVLDIGKAVECDIHATDLRDIYRLPGKPDASRPVVAEFTQVACRNNFLSSVRAFNKTRPINEKLNTKTIGIPGETKAIYVDEHLTPALKKLLFETRQFAKANNYSNWHSNGKIYIRTDPDAKPVQIKSNKCLAFLLKR